MSFAILTGEAFGVLSDLVRMLFPSSRTKEPASSFFSV